jgi:hypothetical protein
MKTSFVENVRGFISKKEESIIDLSNKVLHFLEALKNIDEDLFSNWYEQARSKKKALEKKVVFEKEFVQKVIEKAWDKKFPNLGSNLIFWSGNDDNAHGSQIYFRIGLTSDNKNLRNRVIVSLPTSENLRIERNDKRIEDIVKIMKKIWEAKEVEIDFIENLPPAGPDGSDM